MIRRAVTVFIEMGLWFLVMAMLLNGCSTTDGDTSRPTPK